VHIYRIFDGYEYDPTSAYSVFAAYLERWVMNGAVSKKPMLICIRQIAERLCRDNDTLEISSCIKSLCVLVIKRNRWRQVLDTKEAPSDQEFSAHLLSAAAFTNTFATVERHFADGFRWTSSWLFGDARENAVAKGSHQMIEFLIRRFPEIRGARMDSFVDAAVRFNRSLETVRFIFNLGIEEEPWRFGDAASTRERQCDALNTALHTSCPEVWEYVAKLREEYPARRERSRRDRHRPIDENMLESALAGCVQKGWTAMTRYLIGLGASMLEIAAYGRFIQSCQRGFVDIIQLFLDHDTDYARRLDTTGAIAAAASHGHTSVVRLLLDYDASTTGGVAHAASGGYVDIVELLLDHGCSPDGFIEVNEHKVKTGELIPLVAAVQLEHVRLFHLLLERGASLVNQEAGLKCAKLAKENGLGSMLDLLKECGVDVDADLSVVELPLQKLSA
jgi:hypothetical protein